MNHVTHCPKQHLCWQAILPQRCAGFSAAADEQRRRADANAGLRAVWEGVEQQRGWQHGLWLRGRVGGHHRADPSPRSLLCKRRGAVCATRSVARRCVQAGDAEWVELHLIQSHQLHRPVRARTDLTVALFGCSASSSGWASARFGSL
jgi:hypothetical protein